MTSEDDTTPDSSIREEQLVLGAAIASVDVADALAYVVQESDFGDHRHRIIWTAIRAVRVAGDAADYGNLDRNLRKAGLLDKIGGIPYLHDCHSTIRDAHGDIVTFHGRNVANAGHRRRQEQQVIRHQRIMESGGDEETTARLLAELAAEMLVEVDRVPGANPTTEASLFVPGGGFVLDAPDIPTAVWGDGDHVIWAEGEALMITGGQGVGKSTVGLQVVRARMGLQDKVLGYSVQTGEKKVLYCAMDRPSQLSRAAGRIFTEDERKILDERLVIWKGPPPQDLAANPEVLTRMTEQAGADTVVVDSLKDAAIGLSDDKVGAGYNRARQHALAAGVQVMELHHAVKRGANGGEPNSLADVYGSTWLTSGAGSVIGLWGNAGDPVVSWRHLKQPSVEVGPFRVVHDHQNGTSEVEGRVDVLMVVRRTGPGGCSALELAVAMFETVKPSRAEVEKARRELEKRTDTGLLSRVGGGRGGDPARYYLRLAG